MEEKQSRLAELQEEHKNFMQEVNTLKASKVKEEQKLEAVEKKMHEIQREIPSIQNKVIEIIDFVYVCFSDYLISNICILRSSSFCTKVGKIDFA